MTGRARILLGGAAAFAVGLLYLPMLAVAIFSVNASKHGFVWRGFTLEWYRKLASHELVLEAAWNTFVLAIASTALATLLGTALAIGVYRYPWPRSFRRFLDFSLYLPVVTPDIIFAAALVLIFGLLRKILPVFAPGMFTMIVAHVTFQIAFVALVVGSRLATIGRDLEEAARDLYAGTPYLLRRVMLPLLMPGILAGALLAFTLSLDDFVISFFTAGPHSVTLPIYIFGSIRQGVTPEIHALSMLIFLLNVVLVIGMGWLSGPKKRSRASGNNE